METKDQLRSTRLKLALLTGLHALRDEIDNDIAELLNSDASASQLHRVPTPKQQRAIAAPDAVTDGRRRRGRPGNSASYWAKMSPEERKAEMARRVNKRKGGKKSLSNKGRSGGAAPGYWTDERRLAQAERVRATWAIRKRAEEAVTEAPASLTEAAIAPNGAVAEESADEPIRTKRKYRAAAPKHERRQASKKGTHGHFIYGLAQRGDGKVTVEQVKKVSRTRPAHSKLATGANASVTLAEMKRAGTMVYSGPGTYALTPLAHKVYGVAIENQT